MSDYSEILKDPYNPCVIENGVAKFPSWLTDKIYTTFQPRINWSFTDHVIQTHASFYDATVWYPWIEKWTPESRFIVLTKEEINNLIYNQELPKEKKQLVLQNIKDGFQFVKSSKKSSHFRGKIKNYEKFIEEITHPQVVMSFKNGHEIEDMWYPCIFMRKYINIKNEYRLYVYKNVLRYVEKYITKEDDADIKQKITDYFNKIRNDIKYEDYVIDLGTTSDGLVCIEINTPLYLFCGLHKCDYYFRRDDIHNAAEPIFNL